MASIIPQSLLDHRLLTEEDRHTLIRPGGVATQRTVLLFLQGLLAERGGTRLSEAKTAALQAVGVAAGRTLLAELLSDHTITPSHPERLLRPEEAAPFYYRIEAWKDKDSPDPRQPLTCEKVLNYLGRIRAQIQIRRDAIALNNQTK